jgi:hypothetical protein
VITGVTIGEAAASHGVSPRRLRQVITAFGTVRRAGVRHTGRPGHPEQLFEQQDVADLCAALARFAGRLALPDGAAERMLDQQRAALAPGGQVELAEQPLETSSPPRATPGA